MIELDDQFVPNGVEPRLIDRGTVLRGGASVRVDRAGSRYGTMLSFPPMVPQRSRVLIADLLRAKREGLRVEVQLLGEGQGIPGVPVVDGAGQSGASIAIRGLTPAYIAKKGFWLNLIEADGTRYLHNVSATAVADGTGAATVQIEPPLRAPFADGDTVELAKPMIEGFVDGEEWSWSVPVNHLIAVSVPLEEYQ